MKEEKYFDEEITKTLSAYDDDLELQENPFLLTRIQELRKQRRNNSTAKRKVVLRTNLVLAVLVMLINAATLFFYFNAGKSTKAEQRLINYLKEEFQVEQTKNEL